MIKGNYLSDVIDLEQIYPYTANIIAENTGCGKTTMALNKLVELADSKNKVLYLIDSVAGKQQLLQRKDTIYFDETWIDGNGFGEFPDRVVVMTYAKFGNLVKKYSEFTKQLQLIICDEAHQLPNFIAWDRATKRKENPLLTEEELTLVCSLASPSFIALQEINELCNGTRGEQYVVIMSATPNKIIEALNTDINKIEIESALVAYETLGIKYYRNIFSTIKQLPLNQKAIVYLPRITQMERAEAYAKSLGLRTCSLWSTHNTEHPMTQEQLEVRELLINEQKLPQEIDVLFINKSYETSINIFDSIQTMVIHSTQEDVITQVRGRLRADLPLLYLYKKDSNEFEIPEEYLDVPLDITKKKTLAEIMGIRNSNRQIVGWNTISKLLTENGYVSIDKRINNKRYTFIKLAV